MLKFVKDGLYLCSLLQGGNLMYSESADFVLTAFAPQSPSFVKKHGDMWGMELTFMVHWMGILVHKDNGGRRLCMGEWVWKCKK